MALRHRPTHGGGVRASLPFLRDMSRRALTVACAIASAHRRLLRTRALSGARRAASARVRQALSVVTDLDATAALVPRGGSPDAASHSRAATTAPRSPASSLQHPATTRSKWCSAASTDPRARAPSSDAGSPTPSPSARRHGERLLLQTARHHRAAPKITATTIMTASVSSTSWSTGQIPRRATPTATASSTARTAIPPTPRRASSSPPPDRSKTATATACAAPTCPSSASPARTATIATRRSIPAQRIAATTRSIRTATPPPARSTTRWARRITVLEPMEAEVVGCHRKIRAHIEDASGIAEASVERYPDATSTMLVERIALTNVSPDNYATGELKPRDAHLDGERTRALRSEGARQPRQHLHHRSDGDLRARRPHGDHDAPR